MKTESDAALNEGFKKIFNFYPHEFQREVVEYLLSGRNVILQAPTGAGKTEAALFPYLLAHQEERDFPSKLLYIVPMRVLAKSFHERLTRPPAGEVVGVTAKVQTGEQQDDRQLRSNIIFTTIDQVLSSFLNIPYALSLRQGNVNAGAVVGSYLVFDEFHLFDPDTAMPTVVEMLKMLNGIAPFLLMTATFSKPLLERLAKWLDAETVTVSEEELSNIRSQRNKQRRYQACDTPLMECADAVIEKHQARSLVICNTVARAQEMYRQLRDRLHGSKTDVLLLHSRFLKQDRQEKEDEVRVRFGKSAASDNVILVATQVIEVGLDITCERLHTEIAPASAIFQRAGRCARFEGESGTVIVYPAPLMKDGKPNYHPYAELKRVCKASFVAFQKRNGSVLDFAVEQEVINEVHSETDKQMLNRLSALPTRSKMSECIGGLKREMARELIRQNDSVTVFISEPPERLTDPFRVEGFSLYRGTLLGQWRTLKEQAQARGLDWVFKYPVEDKSEVETKSANTRAKPTFHWKAVTPSDDLRTLPSVLFAIHPEFAAYDDEVGFRFEPGGQLKLPKSSEIAEQEKRTFIPRFRRETYTQHINHLLAAYEHDLRDELSFAAARLEAKLLLPAGAIDRAARLCLALHDVGKLTVGWQKWAHDWQAAVGQPVDENYMVAHTDFDGEKHGALEKTFKTPRPPHAVEGMRAVAPAIVAEFGQDAQDLIKAILTAIARHHSPLADEFKRPFTLDVAAEGELESLLADVDSAVLIHLGKLTRHAQPRSLANVLVRSDDTLTLLTYFLLVRALRLADQRATEEASKEG